MSWVIVIGLGALGLSLRGYLVALVHDRWSIALLNALAVVLSVYVLLVGMGYEEPRWGRRGKKHE